MERPRNLYFHLSAIWLIHVYHKTLLQIINHVFRGKKKKKSSPFVPVYDSSFTIFRLGFQSRSSGSLILEARSIRKIRDVEEYLIE